MKHFLKVLAVTLLVAATIVLGCSCSQKTDIQTEVIDFDFEPSMIEETVIEEEIDIEEFTFEKVSETWDNATTISYWKWQK